MNTFDSFLQSHGVEYKIYRQNQFVATAKGLPNEDDNGKEYIGFKPGTDIEKGDLIINSVNEKFYILKKQTDFEYGKPFQIAAYTIPESEYQNQPQQKNNIVFNVSGVQNSIIGTQQNATITNGYSIEDLTNLIDNHNTEDKELLKEIIALLEDATSNKKTMKKGFLSKFSDVMSKNEWITAPIATFILEKFLL